MVLLATYLFVALAACISVLQLGLGAGLPWGHLAMGGKFPARWPPAMRVLTLVNIALQVFLSAVVLARAGVAFAQWHLMSDTLIWGVVGLSVLALIMNLATPSKWERRLWAPAAALMLVSALVVAFSAHPHAVG